MVPKSRRVEVRMTFSGNEGGFVAGLPPSITIVYTASELDQSYLKIE